MSFLTPNIDRAIVMTQYDLRGFVHPFGLREEERHSKSLAATTCNFVAFAAGMGKPEKTPPAHEPYASYFDSSFEDYLAMVNQLHIVVFSMASRCEG